MLLVVGLLKQQSWLVFGNYFMETITVKDAKKVKKSRNFGKKVAATTVIVLGFSAFGVMGAKAATLQDLQKLLSDVGTVINAVSQITTIAESFSTIPDNIDATTVAVVLGLLSPVLAFSIASGSGLSALQNISASAQTGGIGTGVVYYNLRNRQ